MSDRVFHGDRMLPMVCVAIIMSADLLWLARPEHASSLSVLACAAVLGATASGWNGLFATVQAEIGGRELAGSAIGAGLTLLYIVGAFAPPLFGALVDRTNFTIGWQVLAAIAAAAVIPALFARRLLLVGRNATA